MSSSENGPTFSDEMLNRIVSKDDIYPIEQDQIKYSVADMLGAELDKLTELEKNPIDVLNASNDEALGYVHDVAYASGRISVLTELLEISFLD